MNPENSWKVIVNSDSVITIINKSPANLINLDAIGARDLIIEIIDAITESERIKESLRVFFYCPICRGAINRTISLVSNDKFFCGFCSRYWLIEECKK